ncbi:DoxX family protein [Nocardia sp. NPDC051832]|uniref:DoxX family protein n=1 Tax=Nocardia sp. NPDC051832 TaxID=3155673 RepID=UPI003441650B
MGQVDGAGRVRDAVIGERAPWHPMARIGFRFCVSYFLLFGLAFTQIVFLFAGAVTDFLSEESVLWRISWLTAGPEWVGRTVFGVDAPLRMSESGDQAYIWVLICCLLLLAVLVTIVWTVRDRRTEYARLGAWFVWAARIVLGTQLLWYGIAKLVPNQMPYPPLTTLLEPFGGFTRMEVLWHQVGISPVYQMLLGAVEVLAAVLLLFARTATLGGLLALVCLAQVFVLNMTYDVPVKLFSFHLLSLTAVVLAPQARTLANILVLQRSSAPAVQPVLSERAQTNHIAKILPLVLGLMASVTCLRDAWQCWHDWGYGAAKPALYGIWDVTEFSADGRALPPLTTDEFRWQRLIVDIPGRTQQRTGLAFQRMNGTLVPARGEVNAAERTIAMPGIATFAYHSPTPELLFLQGDLNGLSVTVSLTRHNLDDFRVRRPGFHWVQESLPRD